MSLLRELAQAATQAVEGGYYDGAGTPRPAPSLAAAIERTAASGRVPVIAELKRATPHASFAPVDARAHVAVYRARGACALSVLTEPTRFQGSLDDLDAAVETGLPVLMKDFMISKKQIECAARHGASAVLLIAGLHDDEALSRLIDRAHVLGREVLLEVSSRDEFEAAMRTEADLVGINNRDLATFHVDLNRTPEISRRGRRAKPVVSLSGIRSSADIARLRPFADAFLVGSALMERAGILEELVAP